MKKRTILLLALLGLTAILEACNMISHGREGNPSTQQIGVNKDSLPSAGAQNNTTNPNYIGETKALETALSHAGVNSSILLYSHAAFDFDDGRATYDVEFFADNKEYDYTIDAMTGNIIEFDADMEYDFVVPKTEHPRLQQNQASQQGGQQEQQQQQQSQQQQPQQQQQQQSQQQQQQQSQQQQQQQQQPASNSGDIGIEAAKQIALGKVPGADESHIRINQDYDNGRLKYEGKIIYNNMEYEFEIDAANGTITDWDQESIYD